MHRSLKSNRSYLIKTAVRESKPVSQHVWRLNKSYFESTRFYRPQPCWQLALQGLSVQLVAAEPMELSLLLKQMRKGAQGRGAAEKASSHLSRAEQSLTTTKMPLGLASGVFTLSSSTLSWPGTTFSSANGRGILRIVSSSSAPPTTEMKPLSIHNKPAKPVCCDVRVLIVMCPWVGLHCRGVDGTCCLRVVAIANVSHGVSIIACSCLCASEHHFAICFVQFCVLCNVLSNGKSFLCWPKNGRKNHEDLCGKIGPILLFREYACSTGQIFHKIFTNLPRNKRNKTMERPNKRPKRL